MEMLLSSSESSLASLINDAVLTGPFSEFGDILGCVLSIIFGGFVGVFGSSFIMMAAVFGIAAFPQMPSTDIAIISASLVGMVAVEALLIYGSVKGAMNYCPAVFGSAEPEPTQ